MNNVKLIVKIAIFHFILVKNSLKSVEKIKKKGNDWNCFE